MKIKTPLALLLSGFFALSSAQAAPLTDLCKQYQRDVQEALKTIPAGVSKAEVDAAKATLAELQKEIDTLSPDLQNHVCKVLLDQAAKSKNKKR